MFITLGREGKRKILQKPNRKWKSAYGWMSLSKRKTSNLKSGMRGVERGGGGSGMLLLKKYFNKIEIKV